MPPRDFDVFLAYNAMDHDAVKRAMIIEAGLNRDGLRVCDAQRDLGKGRKWTEAMTKALDASTCCFMLYGEQGPGIWTFYEMRLTIRDLSPDFRIFSVLLPGASDTGLLNNQHSSPRLDLRDRFGGSALTEVGLAEVLVAARGVSPGELIGSRATESRAPAGTLSDAAATRASPRIFISYRREDSEGHTGRLYDELARRFGDQHVFMDIDSVPLGVDFTRVIADKVGSCDVLIAVIGRDWITASDETGNRRLDNPEDYVRLEVKAALERDVRVIPALVHNAPMPTSDELPEDLADLARRNGIFLRADSWHPGVERLIRAIEEVAFEGT